MSPTIPDSLARLRAANPVRVQADHGRNPVAQDALQRILAGTDEPRLDPGPTGTRARRARRWRSPRTLIVVLAALLLGAGAAVGASDPFGWWSPNPDTAQYGVNPAVHVRTPSAQEINCRPAPAGGFRCAAGGPGRRYTQIDAIRPPVGSAYSRAHFEAAITQELAAGQISAESAARFRADLARVRDSFFTKLQLGSRFGTYGAGGPDGSGRELVPPAGVPAILVCENAGLALACQDLNGDLHAPVGAGVYTAVPASDWRPAPPHQRGSVMPPGISPFTPAEYQVLIDLVRAGRTISSSSGVHGRSAAPQSGPTRSTGR